MSHKSNMKCFRTLVNYILDLQKTKGQFLLTRNFRGIDKSKEAIVEQFVINERKRDSLSKRRKNIFAFHDIVSISALDKENISEADILKIAREYMKMRSNKSLACCAYHAEPQPHLHFIFSGVQYHNHRAARIEKSALADLKKHMEEFQEQYLNLQHSTVAHGKGGSKLRPLEREYRLKARTQKLSIKEHAHLRIQKIYERAGSPKSFLEQLQTSDIPVYERNGKLTGIYINNRRIRLSSLGFDKEKIRELDIVYKRMKDFEEVRKRKQERGRERER